MFPSPCFPCFCGSEREAAAEAFIKTFLPISRNESVGIWDISLKKREILRWDRAAAVPVAQYSSGSAVNKELY